MTRTALLIIVLSSCARGGAPATAPTAATNPTEATGSASEPRNTRPSRAYAWAVELTSSKVAEATGVAADASGHVFVAGRFTGVMTLGDQQYETAGGSDVFLARLSADDGAVEWSKQLGGRGEDSPSSLALTSAGDVVISGSIGGRHAVWSYSGGDGAERWVTSFESKAAVDVRGIAADSNGNVIVGGTFFKDTKVGDAKLFHVGKSDIFVAKLSGADGKVVWAESIGNPGNNTTRSIAVDAAGNIYVAGSFSGTVNVGDAWLKTPGKANDIFVASLDPAGKTRWASQLAVSSVTVAWDLASSAAGDTVLVGVFSGETRFNGQPAVAAGGYDGFAAAHDADGSPSWTAQHGGEHADSWRMADISLAGQVLLTGTADVVRRDAGGLRRTTGGAIVVTAYSPRGDHEWTVRAEAQGDASPWAATVDPFGHVYVAGSFSSTIDFTGHVIGVEAQQDAFIAKLIP